MTTAPFSAAIAYGPVFDPSTSREDVIEAYPELEAVCDALGFVAHRPLSACCYQPDDALVELARAAMPPPVAPLQVGNGAGIADLVRDIIATHHRVARNEIARLGILLNHHWHRHPGHRHNDAEHSYETLATTMVAHLDHEEQTLFPLCLTLGTPHHAPPPRHGRQPACAIDLVNAAHVDTAAYVAALATHVRHLPAAATDDGLLRIGHCLAGMAADLVMHQHKEDDLLMPAVMAMATHDRGAG